MFGLDYVVFRPHNVYGERQNIGDRYRNVVGIFMNQILQGKPMRVFGDGSQSRAFSYIGDLAPIMAAAIETPAARNQVFNIGADTPTTVGALAAAAAHAMGVDARHPPCPGSQRSAAHVRLAREGEGRLWASADHQPRARTA